MEYLLSASVVLVGDEDLLRAATAVRQGTTRLARRLRIERPETSQTALELGILAHLHRRGPMTPGALAAAERVQPQSLTRTLASLERQHLAVRQPDDQDHRRSLLAITDAGRQALATDMRQRDAWLAGAMARQLTRAEQELLRIAGGLLDRLADDDARELHDPGGLSAHRTENPPGS
jgi:DNA-binding MarR family transcriptional regulator